MNAVKVVVRVVEHQAHVQRDGRDPVNGAHHRRANRQVGHEVAVHHVDVQQVGAATLDGGDVLPERREIRGQQRRSDQHLIAHLAADLERDRLPRGDLKPRLRILPQDEPGGDAGVGVIADHRGPEAAGCAAAPRPGRR